jgi:SpoVK/Ycf46/Vps4 family AAA+-type ATPase
MTNDMPDLLFHLRSMSRIIYFVTDEEDRFLLKLKAMLTKFLPRTWVYNAAFGLQPIEALIRDWSTRAHQESRDTLSIHETLIQIYKEDPKEHQNFYVITDAERWLVEPHVQRRVLNIVHQLHNDIRTVKILMFVGSRKVIPEKLSRYIEVIHDTGLTPEEISQQVEEVCGHLKLPVPPNASDMFKGLTSFEVNSAIAQSIVRTKKDADKPKRIDAQAIGEFKRRQVRKTDLVQLVDTSSVTFDQVGGATRFKAWARKMKSAWTEEGRKFGLEHPKGILAVGPWGTGKSLSTKTLGSEWGLPVVQLEMGRLRSSGVGESEANVYRAIKLIEAVAPCIVWIDEAEKSLSGGQSSAQSDAGTTNRTIGIFSTWHQETTARVCLAMTANSLKTLPPEFVNRMDERFFFDLPSEEDRIDILKIHLRERGQDPEKFDLAMLSEKASSMVGREIRQCIKAALLESFAQGKTALDQEILAFELSRKPRIVKTMVDEIREVLEWVGYDPDVDDGIRARFAADPNRAGGAMKLIGGGGTSGG